MIKDTEWFELRKQIAGCRKCSNTTKVWLTALATFANDTGFCYPNQGQIAERMGRKNRKHLERCSKQAAECGHIVVGSKMTSAGKSNNYQLALTPIQVVTPIEEATLDNEQVTQDEVAFLTETISPVSSPLCLTGGGGYPQNRGGDTTQVGVGTPIDVPITPIVTPSLSPLVTPIDDEALPHKRSQGNEGVRVSLDNKTDLVYEINFILDDKSLVSSVGDAL